MPGHNCNHFTGKKKNGDPRKNRKKKVRKSVYMRTNTNIGNNMKYFSINKELNSTKEKAG